MKLLLPLLGVCQSECWGGEGGMMSMDFAKPQNPPLFLTNDTYSREKKVTFKKLKQVDKCFFKWS